MMTSVHLVVSEVLFPQDQFDSKGTCQLLLILLRALLCSLHLKQSLFSLVMCLLWVSGNVLRKTFDLVATQDPHLMVSRALKGQPLQLTSVQM